MERRTAQESYVDLIDSGQFLAAEEIFSERRTDDPLEMVVRAEVANYFGKYDEAANLLDKVKGRATDIEVASRFSLAQGRLALSLNDAERAQTLLQGAYYFYTFKEDAFGASQALLEIARLERKTGQFEQAAEKLKIAEAKLAGRASKKAEYLKGLIISEQAAVLAELGDLEAANKRYEEASTILKGVERGRHYAYTLVGIADLKYALGEFQDSLEIYKEANIVFERYDLKRDRAESQLKLATALIRLKRFERAERMAFDSREIQSNNPAGESAALSVLSFVSLLQNEIEDALSYASKALELADQSKSAVSRARARISLGHVKLASHDFREAAQFLAEAAEIARQSSPSLILKRAELEATIFLAEAYHNFDTRAGRAELTRAASILSGIEDTWLGEEYDRVSAKYEEQIQFTDDNRLVFDGNQLPRWQEAKRTLEGFLLRNALRQTNNSLTRAARKLGVSKVHVHNLKKKHHVE
ncbi:MAG: hypothetical protein AB1757_08870 [Acidobacteriota bacterium]